MKEIKEKIYKNKGKYGSAWLLLKAGIVKIVNVKRSWLSNDVRVKMSFNYWNPLTYIYITFMGVTCVLPAIFMDGFRTVYKNAKKELTTGFEIIIH